MTRQKVKEYIKQCDDLLLYLAGEELRASRSHLPGQHTERYAQLRAEAREIQKLRTDWFNLMPPPAFYLSSGGVLQPAE